MTKEELGKLIVEAEESLYRVSKSLLYNDADCADAIQESIVKAFESITKLRNDRYAKTWLTRILINECYAIMRREKRIVSLDNAPKEIAMIEATTESAIKNRLFKARKQLKELL